MKTWINKFKTSLAMDRESQPHPKSDARRFEEPFGAMECELRGPQTKLTPPVNLHAGIMRAIRQTRPAKEFAVTGILIRRLAGATIALAAGFTLFWMTNQSSLEVARTPPSAETSLSFATAFDEGHALTQTAPKAMLEPLSGEMDQLDHDFRAAVNFLAASVP